MIFVIHYVDNVVPAEKRDETFHYLLNTSVSYKENGEKVNAFLINLLMNAANSYGWSYGREGKKYFIENNKTHFKCQIKECAYDYIKFVEKHH